MFAVVLCAALLAQRFEVATIKPGHGTAIGNRFAVDQLSYTNVPLKVLIQNAWDVKSYQISGGPRWVDTDPWDIAAKPETPVTANRMVTYHRMLQPLLTERFHLEFHREMREVQGYSLVLVKGGHKMEEAEDGKGGLQVGADHLKGQTTMTNLAFFLAGQLGQPIEDETGLEGTFNFKLEYEPGLEATVETRPDIFTALQQQLGLKLEPHKVALEVLVIDRAEKPSET